MAERTKSSTDMHWNERATEIADGTEVNIKDIYQRDVEFRYILPCLTKGMRVLEVGCGNGFSTARFRRLVKHVDAFDYSENMIERAKAAYGEVNNRFFVDSILDPRRIEGEYDAVVCVRVLINLRDADEQKIAIRNLAVFVKDGGVLVLAEGFTEGFEALSELRRKMGLPPVVPAAINCYSSVDDLLPLLQRDFVIESTFHLGAYDYLTRIVYPMVVGADKVTHNGVFSERSARLALEYNPDCFEKFSRVRGYVLRKNG